MQDFVDRLRDGSAKIADPERRVGFYGQDLFSLPSLMDAVVDYGSVTIRRS